MNLAEATIVRRLERDLQLRFIAEARSIAEQSRLFRPQAGGRPMSVKITNAGALGWVADELGYRYTSAHPRTGRPWPPIPQWWLDFADDVAGREPWDCAHLIWYEPGASLGWHRDKTERTRRPIVTLSLGDDATWAVRLDEREPIHRARLYSGYTTLLSGETRDALHSIEAIEPAPALLAPSPLPTPGRLAISIRVAG
ncbi:MAG: alpha-ketoglutarate-dependent dioxygenase AlkB [Myxococcales bacterium]|nr:alpha-ketoglutarate-dependent dioxygenase AlkB [Myxococcales bacterium]